MMSAGRNLPATLPIDPATARTMRICIRRRGFRRLSQQIPGAFVSIGSASASLVFTIRRLIRMSA